MGIFRYFKDRYLYVSKAIQLIHANSSIASDIRRYRVDLLKEKVINCKDEGITNGNICNEEVIVSLTTFGKRINEVYLAIESIMQGTVKPNRIILWLAKDEFMKKALPHTLQFQQKRGLQIEYCEDIRSYKKIVPTILKYPDACVVTIDDDAIYEFDLLENLINAHIDNPDDVCASRIHRIVLGKDKKPVKYSEWQKSVWPTRRSNLNFLTGVGGVLYPPHCFSSEFMRDDLFMSLCPYADDIWINTMIWMNGRNLTKSYTHSPNGDDFIDLHKEKDASDLCTINVLNGMNDIQLKAVMDKFDLYHYLQE